MFRSVVSACLMLGVLACDGSINGDDGSSGDGTGDGSGSGPVEARATRRLSAEQFHRSLTAATGQEWSDYERFAAALGRPDFATVNQESRDISVTFDKLVHDAARVTCRDAVQADVDSATDVILRHATLEDREPAKLEENLSYLHLRFLTAEVASGDERLRPWMDLLGAPFKNDKPPYNEMKNRWTAVCVGLATHPDFLTY